MFNKIGLFLIFGVIGTSSAVSARASTTNFLFEPGIAYTMGSGKTSLAVTSGGSTTSYLYDPGLSHGVAAMGRIGLVREGLFSAVDINTSMIFSPATMTSFSLGLTVGGALTYLPFRVWAGIYLLDRMFTDVVADANSGSLSFGGQAYKAGFGFDLSDSVVATLEIIGHNYSDSQFSSASSSSVDFRMTTITLGLSMPITVFMPKTPWRKQRSGFADAPAAVQ